MNKIWDFLTQHYSIFYKVFLFLVSLVILVSFFPKEAKFKYEYTKGRPWQHDDLIAPFDFPLLKALVEVDKERNENMAIRELFFDFNIQKSETIRTEFIDNINNYWALKYGTSDSDKNLKQASLDRGLKILTATLNRGIIQTIPAIENKPPDYQITLIISNTAEKVRLGDLYNIHTAYEKIKNMLAQSEGVDAELLKLLLEESMTQNVSYNESMTQKELQNYLNQISSTRGMTQEGERIISKGELINKNKFQILDSLRQEYEARM